MDIKFIIIVVLMITAIFVFLGLVYPKFTEIQIIRQEIDSESAVREEAEKKAKTIQDEIQEYESLKESDVRMLDQALPEDADLPNLYVRINSLIASSGLITRDIIIEGGSTVELAGVDNTNEDSAPASVPSFNQTSVTVVADGSYNSLKEFLKKSEETLRIMDVQAIIFSPVSTGAGLAEGFSFKITANVYHKK